MSQTRDHADARVLVADRFAGRLADSPYVGRYQRLIAVDLIVRVADHEHCPWVLPASASVLVARQS
jgi:hypothetical protein